MSTSTLDSTAMNHVPSTSADRKGPFLTTYVFATDHKVIGLQFLFTSFVWMLLGGLLALAMRWQLAYPGRDLPLLGRWLFAAEGGQVPPDFYNALFTLHGTVMVFLVIIPILSGALGNYLIPLMIGARDMAFPRLNMLSYWLMWPASVCFLCSWGATAGWTSYPPLALSPGDAQTWWLAGLTAVSVSSTLGAINYITTIVQLRAPGMTLFRMPMTIWSLWITAMLQALALPVLTVAGLMQILDRVGGTAFFLPAASTLSSAAGQAGQPLLWQHLFWFYSHPAVYVMILPAMGVASDIISCFSRKPLFGYRAMIYATMAIAGLGFIVWGHHMFVSGMLPQLGTAFQLSTMLIALPSAIKVFNWIGTMWGGAIRLTSAMLFATSFVSMFIIGGLSGIFLAAASVDIYMHDTYFVVAHLHYVLFGGSVMALFAAIYFWYPKMFGRTMNETWGKVHFALTFLLLNGTFYPMHLLGIMGLPRRLAEPGSNEIYWKAMPINQWITWCAIGLGVAQVIFAINLLVSLRFGRTAGPNPWEATTLEWQTASPPPHHNFTDEPMVYHGPYEYGLANRADRYLPQNCSTPASVP